MSKRGCGSIRRRQRRPPDRSNRGKPSPAIPVEPRLVLFGPAPPPPLPLPPPAAKEPTAAVGLEARHDQPGRHPEALQNLSRSRIDSPQFALFPFPGAVPEFVVDPGDSGDEAIRFDGAKNRAALGIDLMNLPVSMFSHPERPFGPSES